MSKFFLILGLFFVSACGNKGKVMGSCNRTGDAASGVIAACEETDKDLYETTDEKAKAKQAACEASTNSTWRKETACDADSACGYCKLDIPNGGEKSRYYYYDTEGLKDDEATFEKSCKTGGATTWVDNPNVTCQ